MIMRLVLLLCLTNNVKADFLIRHDGLRSAPVVDEIDSKYQIGGDLSFIERLYESRQISREYYEGSYLIFNCDDGHFACVNERGFNYCKDKREYAVARGEYFLPCGPLKKFKDLTECLHEQDQHVYSLFNKSFCHFNRSIQIFR
ncbi:MAG: hypothetical protein H6622_16630 [Halobacteriovoraceae bacterium]|nr:hypothetical protein [Halobacteriovoraceae bacterium]